MYTEKLLLVLHCTTKKLLRYPWQSIEQLFRQFPKNSECTAYLIPQRILFFKIALIQSQYPPISYRDEEVTGFLVQMKVATWFDCKIDIKFSDLKEQFIKCLLLFLTLQTCLLWAGSWGLIKSTFHRIGVSDEMEEL